MSDPIKTSSGLSFGFRKTKRYLSDELGIQWTAEVIRSTSYRCPHSSSLKNKLAALKGTIYSLLKLSVHLCYFMIFFAGCGKPERINPALFHVLTSDKTQLHFINKLTPTPGFNMFKYLYYYNGGGVGVGDFNNDGLIDIFFSANQGANKIFINEGNLIFKDVTQASLIPHDSGWSTGVSVVDINNDGMLDIYVCKVGQYETLKGRNELLVCERIDQNGVPIYSDKAKDYGLDFSGFSTQAAFLDYDLDGDLDMYLMNHAVHHSGYFRDRAAFNDTHDSLSGDYLFRNDGNKFTDVTQKAGINNSPIGYGLGLSVADINLDGYPDIYVGNDFHENDYLYINQKNGSFRDELSRRIMHTSQFSMGVDIADINNDVHPEIVTLDMLPADPYILKRSLGDNEYNIFNMKIGFGYNYQYSRNTLQLNRGDGHFSECAMYANIAATDWSWAPLWLDFDNDGLKDLFISNGIPKRLNDMDYVNFVSNEQIQEKIRENRMDEKDMALIEKFPEIKLKNKFFKNTANLVFEDMAGKVTEDQDSYSNGSAYADFDNDGDLDVVVNNIDDPPLLYENKTAGNAFLSLRLRGAGSNKNAVGAKVLVYTSDGLRSYEKFPVRGFQSSMETPLHIGWSNVTLDSIILVWPDNSYQQVQYEKGKQVSVSYQPGLPRFDYTRFSKADTVPGFSDITRRVGLQYQHKENPFIEFDREPLMPFMVSREGPALAVMDVNHDGLEDAYIGSSKGNKSAVFLQTRDGKFSNTTQPDLDKDSIYEDVSACWADVNNDSHIDLIVASGGNEYYGTDEHLQPRIYLNNGNGILSRVSEAFAGLHVNASSVIASDFTGDGYVDLFVGGRSVPWEYGKVPYSYLLENDKSGKFRDVTLKYGSQLSRVGFVTHATWCDIDRDGDNDIIVSLEWGGIQAFINNRGRFEQKIITQKKGWWTFTLPCDIDNDGDIDLIAGNLGLNNRFKASDKEPVRMYYHDFDGNGKREQLLTYYLQGREIAFANKEEIQKQIPGIKNRFLYAGDFARATLQDIFTKNKLKEADTLTANYFSNAVLINERNEFILKALPWEAQLTPYKDAIAVKANNDHLPDILMVGNFYPTNIQMGRYDADYGTVLINEGKGIFACENITGLQIKGEARKLARVRIGKDSAFLVARNNDSLMVIRTK